MTKIPEQKMLILGSLHLSFELPPRCFVGFIVFRRILEGLADSFGLRASLTLMRLLVFHSSSVRR